MEQFVLGIFQEHLSKFIVGFRKEQVNANLLNGKGEITNVELNCSFLNEEIRKVSPYIELESVHVSKLSFHVSSWTNVRQSPIVIDIEHVKAVMREALHFTEKCQRAQIRQVTRAELIRLVQSGVVPKPRTTSYNLLDRILDNLTVEIRSVNLTFQPAGKFKTRRPGPWTPPAVRLQLFAVRLVSVNEYGQEASPDEVWRHNHHRRRDGSFLIYKKLETEYQISIVTKKKPSAADPDDNISKNGCAIQEDEDTAPDDHARSSVVDVFDDDDDDELVIPILSSSPKGGGACINNRKKIEIQLALQRRIRDGEYLAIQVDATVPVLDIELAVSTVPHLANFAAAMTYCLAKDRAFTDPLRSTSYVAPNSLLQPLVTAIVDTGSISDEDSSTPIESPGLRSSSLLDLDLEDEASVSSSENEEEADENNEVERSVESDESLEEENGSQSPGSDEGKSAAPVTQPDEKSNAYAGPPSHGTISKPLQTSATTPTSKARSVNNRPLLVLPNGITFHDKISMSVSFHHVTVRGTYAESVDGHIKIIAKGVVAEAIWPKVTMEKGGYIQASVSYVLIQEQHAQRIRPLLVGGAQYDNTGPLEQPVRPLSEVGRDETFPLYEDRSIRPDPLGLRHTFPGQAFGFKMTAYLREKLAVGSPDYSPEVEIAFLNEIGVDQVDIVLDSSAWCRALRFALNVEGGGFDPRWHSGDYSEYMTADMLLHPSVPLRLEDCLQSSKQFFLDENDFPSSDLFNATVRSTNICFRVPAAISEDIRSCDILIRSSEVMLTISSALPRTLVHEDVATQGDSIEFPNDPSDVVYTLEKAEDPSNRQRGIMTSKAMSTFRFQLTVRGLAVQLEPVIPFHASKEAQQLLLPAEMTMIFCFEGELLELSSEKNLARIVLFISVIVHRLELNFDFDLIASAAITFSFHLKNVLITAAACSGGAYGNKPSEGTEAEGMVGRTRNSLRGRKVLVRRQITRSRESGGLSVACCANVFETRVCIWRQNIPRKRPLCSANKDTGEYVPLLRIIDFAFKKIDFGIEASFCQEQSRLLIKTSVAKISLEVCDFESVLQTDSVWTKSYVHSSQSQVPVGEVTMAKIFSCGSEESKRFAFAFRFEEVLDITRSWSLSSDFADGLVDCQVDELQTFVLLVLDSLLMPCWVRFEPGESQKMRLFPRDTLGNFLMSLLPDLPSVDIADHLKRDDAQIRDELMRSLPGKKIDRVLKVVTKALPMTVDMLLLRVSMNNLLLRIPTGGASPLLSNYDGVGLKLCDASFVASYFATDIAEQVRILDVFAQKREKWSSVVLTREKGLRHGLKSRQSVLFTKSGSEGFAKQVEEGLVEEFEFGYSYGDSKISVLTPDDILIANVDKLEDFLVFILRFADRCNVVFANTATILKAAVGHVGSNVNDVTPRESPISMACSSAVESLRSVKSWFRRINDTLGTYDELTQSVVTEKDKEIANLRQLVFLKEKERLAALALVSSEVTGWLRLGTAQRSGQRGLMSCMLWPHWVMLRRSLLLLYAGPGQPGVVDIISLNCASLRELDGGQRKRDLKRAFAIVEKSGTVHFVTAGSDAEYVTWVSGIQLAITFYSPKQPETSANGLSDLDASSHSKGEDARLQSSNHGKPLGRSIARVVNAAKVKGKSVAVRGMKSPWQESTSQIIDQEASINESTAGAMSNSLRESNKMVNSSDSTSSNTESRRQQLRNRFSGVSQATKRGLGSAGQVTKSRFGSVLSAAKQRGQEVAQKRRMRATTEPEDVFVDLSTASITPGAERVSTDEVWPCSACTFINPGDYTKCQVCESERSIPAYNISDLQSQDFTLECQLDDKDAVIDETDEINALDDLTEQGEKGSMRGDPFQSQGISSLPEDGEHSRDDDDRSIDAGNADDFNVDYHSITSDQLDDNEFDELEPRLRIKQRLGAAVRHARKVTSDSQRFSISRRNSRQENSERVPLGAPNSVKLRNIALSGPLKPPVHAFGEGCAAGAAMTGIPLKKFEGLWFARVEISSGSQPTKATTGISFRATAVDLAEELKVVDDSKNDKCETGDAETRDDGFMTTDSRSDGNEVRLSRSNALRATPPRVVEAGNNEEMTFRIQVFQHNGEQSSSLTTDVLKKLPEILALHTSLSESIARVPSYLFDSEPNVGRTCVAGMSENLTRTLGLTPLDAARITGKLLGGLLDVSQRRNLNLKLHSSYLVETVSEFLNAMLFSPLPVDGLVDLADFFELSNVSTCESTVEGDHINTTAQLNAHTKVESNNPIPVMAGEILSLSSLCDIELFRAVNQTILAEKLSKSTYQDHVNERDTTVVGSKSSFPVPSLPFSASSQFRDAMHAALMKVMEERDEAHARMVSAEVLHVHEMEQQRKMTAHLSKQLTTIKNREESKGSKFRGEKEKREAETLQRYERSLQQDADVELLSLCQQLAGEISARTSASLEVVRLKENRKVEQEHEVAEMTALRNEVMQLKQQLAEQRKKVELARQESGSWRGSFQEVVQIREDSVPAISAAYERGKKRNGERSSD